MCPQVTADPPAPPDPRRPPLPYRSGTRLRIRSHLPPVPFGPGYYTQPPARERFMSLLFWNRAKCTQTEWCLQEHPLIETPPVKNEQAHSLHILSEVAVKDGRGPQVVRCYLDECQEKTYVAKIFDPLYYKYPGDASWCADHDYSLESSAYEEIQDAGLDGKFSPRFYGSFSFSLPLLDTPQSTGLTYPARMVLMEDVPGVSMQTLIENYEYHKIPPRLRLDIMAEIMEMECRLKFIGVDQGDLAPRNVMLTMDPNDYTKPPSRVVLLDFSYSSVFTWLHSKDRDLLQPEDSLPKGPIYFWWDQYSPQGFGSWVPRPIGVPDLKAWNGWLLKRWGDAEGWLREPLTDEELSNAQYRSPEPDEISPHDRRMMHLLELQSNKS